jgi:hypothetical protein
VLEPSTLISEAAGVLFDEDESPPPQAIAPASAAPTAVCRSCDMVMTSPYRTAISDQSPSRKFGVTGPVPGTWHRVLSPVLGAWSDVQCRVRRVADN